MNPFEARFKVSKLVRLDNWAGTAPRKVFPSKTISLRWLKRPKSPLKPPEKPLFERSMLLKDFNPRMTLRDSEPEKALFAKFKVSSDVMLAICVGIVLSSAFPSKVISMSEVKYPN